MSLVLHWDENRRCQRWRGVDALIRRPLMGESLVLQRVLNINDDTQLPETRAQQKRYLAESFLVVERAATCRGLHRSRLEGHRLRKIKAGAVLTGEVVVGSRG